MLLSRFWYLILAVAAAAAVGAAMLSKGVINRRSDAQLEDALRRDRAEIEAMLRLEARSRLDRIAFASVDPDLAKLLQKASGADDASDLGDLNSSVKKVMQGHVRKLTEASAKEGDEGDRLEPDIAFAVDTHGRIVAQLGPMQANPPGSSLETYPLVRRALHGYVRDDVWLYDRHVYRMAARPVVYAGRYVGAVLHGYEYDQRFANRLSSNLGGATVAFFYGPSILASYTPEDVEDAPAQADVAAQLEQVLQRDSFQGGKRTEPVDLKGSARAVYSPITGSAASAGVGYSVARPRNVLPAATALFDRASQEDVDDLPMTLLVGGALLAFGMAMLFLYLERDRPFAQLRNATAEIGRGERDRLIITEWRGAYRKMADLINQAVDKVIERAAEIAPGARKKADIDELLGPTPEDQPGGSFFGFAQSEAKGEADSGAAHPPPAPSPGTPSPPQAPPQGGTAPAAPKPPPPRPPAPSGNKAAAPKPPPPAPGAAKAGAAAPAGAAQPTAEGGFDEDAHFREVFEQYVQTREQCGEPTQGLTFEKFRGTLERNRDQILSKHDAKRVRFTVYVKNGKAALKASPIKA